MPIPDNRMRFPPTEIDFASDVGQTGQDHDDYPMAGSQPRYDWMRMSIISLLSQQSSYEEPTQFREGTPWFDLNEMALKIRVSGEWVPYSRAVLISDGYTLNDLYEEFRKLNRVNTQFSGLAAATAYFIAIPATTQDLLSGAEDLTADVFINGQLVYPGNISIGPSQINLLNGIRIVSGDAYTVTIKNVIATNQAPWVLTSPNGTRYRVIVDNTGNLSTNLI